MSKAVWIKACVGLLDTGVRSSAFTELSAGRRQVVCRLQIDDSTLSWRRIKVHVVGSLRNG